MQVLYDIGAVSTPEPFQRLVSQGMILGETEYTLWQNSDGVCTEPDAPGATPVRCDLHPPSGWQLPVSDKEKSHPVAIPGDRICADCRLRLSCCSVHHQSHMGAL